MAKSSHSNVEIVINYAAMKSFIQDLEKQSEFNHAMHLYNLY